MVTTGRGCKATTKAGKTCNGFAVGDGDFCFAHSPDRAAERADARRRGGHARHGRKLGTAATGETVVTIATVGDILKLLEDTANDLYGLENSISRARALISLAGTATKTLEISEIEKRLEALEQRMNEPS